MKKLFIALLAMAALVSCTNELEDRVDALEDRVSALEEKVNTEVQNLASLIDGLKNNVYVTGVTEIIEGDVVIGYTIALSKGSAITIYHGEDGKDGNPGKDGEDGKDGANGANGADGADGADGANGADGKDGSTPQIGVVLENGIYYWTVNGEKLTDENGNYVEASDLSCPKFKKEGGVWFISTDGSTWTQLVSLNTGDENSCVFSDVYYDDSSVTFVIGETEITVPRAEQFKLIIEQTNGIVVLPSSEVTVNYSIKGANEGTAIYAVADAGWGVSVQPESYSAGKIVITSPATVSGNVLVFAGDASHAGMVALSFEEGKVTTTENSFSVGKDGGNIELPISTNLNYEVKSDVDWITYVETRAMRNETVVMNIAANTGYPREASFDIVSAGRTLQTITVSQEAGMEPTYTLEDITGTWENASGNWVIEESTQAGYNVVITTMYGYAGSSIYANFDLFFGTLTIDTPQLGFNYSGSNYYLAVRQGWTAITNGYDVVFNLSEDKKGLAWSTSDYQLAVFQDITYTYYPTVLFSGAQLQLTRPVVDEGGEEGGEAADETAIIGTWTVSYTNTSGSALSFDMPIEASTDASKGNVVLKRWMNYTGRNAEVTIYATYDVAAKTLSIVSDQFTTSASPYYDGNIRVKDAGGNYVNPIVFTVNDSATEMTIDSGYTFGDYAWSMFSSYGSGYKLVKVQTAQ